MRFHYLIYNDLPDDVCNIAIYTVDTTFYCKCDWASDLWKQVYFVSELESDLWGFVDWVREWLADLNAKKNQFALFDHLNNCNVVDMKTVGFILSEKWSSKMLGLSLSSTLDWGSYFFLFVKLPLRKLEPYFSLSSFFLLSVPSISKNL